MTKRQRNAEIDDDDDHSNEEDQANEADVTGANHGDDDDIADNNEDDNVYDDDDMIAFNNVINENDEDEEDDYDADGNHKEAAEEEESKEGGEKTAVKKATKKKKLSLERALAYQHEMSQRGIIYVARIPPRMTPMKMKHLLSMYGTPVTRIFCQKQQQQQQQKKKGPPRYVEGWVEFADKKVAKQIAASLHQQRISNVKRHVHYDDHWCLKYLGSKFTWSILTEKVAYEKRVREQKLRLETMHDRKQIQHYQQAFTTQSHIQQRMKGSSSKKDQL